MATNLVSYVMQFLTPDMIGRIAGALGLSRDDAQTGISAAVPALLAAFSSTAAKPGGAKNLVDIIKQQSGDLGSFSGTIGRGSPSAFVEKGSSMLTSLLGSRDQSALTEAVGKYAGLGQNASNSLLGMLAPVVMGVIGKQVGTRSSLDAGSLSDLLASQKDQIAQALPAGMSKLLGGTGLLDSLSGVAGAAAAAAGQAGRATTAATAQFASSAARSADAFGQSAAGATRSAVPNWVYWAVPLALFAGLLWYVLSDRTEQVAQQVPTPPTQSIVVGSVDIGKQIGDSLGQVRTSLASVTDVPSARAALPRLQAATAQIDRVSSLVGQLPADQRKVVGGLAASATTTIDQLINKVLAIPGVGEVLKPTADNLRTQLADLSGQSPTVGGR
jgi:hypothetical protein